MAAFHPISKSDLGVTPPGTYSRPALMAWFDLNVKS